MIQPTRWTALLTEAIKAVEARAVGAGERAVDLSEKLHRFEREGGQVCSRDERLWSKLTDLLEGVGGKGMVSR